MYIPGHRFLLSLLLFCLGVQITITVAFAQQASGPSPVVVSIRPIHSLVAGVMKGVGEPYLIVRGGGSPHSYSMRPSDAKALSAARVVVWVGEELENFLEDPIEALARKAEVVSLVDVPEIIKHKYREGGSFEKHEHGGSDHGDHRHEGHDHEGIDMHLWLNPRNAKAMVKHVAQVLAKADPAQAALYKTNAAALVKRLDDLDGELAEMLAPLKGARFVVLHDAYQYFEKRYGLSASGSVSDVADRAPGARRLIELRERIRTLRVICLFAEPARNLKILNTVREGTQARLGILDPLGVTLPEGPDLYFSLMRNIATSMRDCLASK